jgi:hypothetical protein
MTGRTDVSIPDGDDILHLHKLEDAKRELSDEMRDV